MFTVEGRQQVRNLLLERARRDERIAGAALTGSAARGTEDQWSDIDLFLGVAAGHSVEDTLRDWSAFIHEELGAVHHFDLHAGPAVYRAFLLGGDLLEIDLGFTPAAAFGPLGDGAFRVVFGTPVERHPAAAGAQQRRHLTGLAWHHVLHARVCIERGALWQAEYWISGIRDQVLALACLRLGLPTAYAKGADRLPSDVTRPLREALVRSLDAEDLTRALQAATRSLLSELRAGPSDGGTATSLEQALRELAALA
ncbi:nucleotidyltransferase domain-containing protein [Streptomyces sp. NPDC002896]|uniref:nucleotidyltransferase domain-containing protein n=1 Tax=Streptomyces sp. NPDC002896 TaxID=3154438 RepID=UPI00331B09FE